jgi:hypothetical protein
LRKGAALPKRRISREVCPYIRVAAICGMSVQFQLDIMTLTVEVHQTNKDGCNQELPSTNVRDRDEGCDNIEKVDNSVTKAIGQLAIND